MQTFHRRVVLGILPLLALLSPTSAPAATATIEYSGTVTNATGIFLGQGTAVTGTLVYDTAIPDRRNTDPTLDEFFRGVNPQLAFYVTVQVGNVFRSTATNIPTEFALEGLSQIDSDSGDAWTFEIPPNRSTDSEARIQLVTQGQTDALLAGSGGLNGTVLIPDPTRFEIAEGFYVARAGTSTVQGHLAFDVVSIAVPEPGSAAAALAASASLLALRCSRWRGVVKRLGVISRD